MGQTDCGFTRGDEMFRYRAGAIIVEDGCVLFATNEKEDYFYSVGGGVHVGERAQDAVVREVLEETGVRYEVDRLAFVHENFWDGHGAYDTGLRCHEIALYFLMKPRGTRRLHSDSRNRYADRETMHWLPVAELDKYRVYPAFMKEYLGREHTGVEHILTDDRRERPARREVRIVPYEEKYRDDMIFLVLEAKDALGRVPTLNQDLLRVGEHYQGRFWLAIGDDDRVVGCVGYEPFGQEAAKLHRLYVKAGLKRQGIGSALLRAAERHMEQDGYRYSVVHLGGPAYFESRQFYPKHGYTEYEPDYMRRELE